MMTNKRDFKGVLMGIIAVLTLSGCSSNKALRPRYIKGSSITSETVQPEEKSVLLSQEIDDLLDLAILPKNNYRSEEQTSELQSHQDLVCRLLF